jgi:hypothetical protein
MNTQTHASRAADDPTSIPLRHGPVRRLLNVWRRLEESMAYGPYDYTLDRIRALEMRVEQLEQRLPAVTDRAIASHTEATPTTTSQDQR